jgi:hypothetical protein
MYKTCRHIKTNGLPCEAPALKGVEFCYFHSKTHTIGAEPYAKFGPIQLPTPEDPASIQLSVARISNAILTGKLDLKKATALFYGLQIAAQFVERRRYISPRSIVQSAQLDSLGDELTPERFTCRRDDDCNDCPFADRCSRCIHDDDEDDEAEDEAQAEGASAPEQATGKEDEAQAEVTSAPEHATGNQDQATSPIPNEDGAATRNQDLPEQELARSGQQQTCLKTEAGSSEPAPISHPCSDWSGEGLRLNTNPRGSLSSLNEPSATGCSCSRPKPPAGIPQPHQTSLLIADSSLPLTTGDKLQATG